MVRAAAGLTLEKFSAELIRLRVQLPSMPMLQDATLAGAIVTASHVSVSKNKQQVYVRLVFHKIYLLWGVNIHFCICVNSGNVNKCIYDARGH